MNMGTFGAMDQNEMMEVNGGVKFSPFGAGCLRIRRIKVVELIKFPIHQMRIAELLRKE